MYSLQASSTNPHGGIYVARMQFVGKFNMLVDKCFIASALVLHLYYDKGVVV